MTRAYDGLALAVIGAVLLSAAAVARAEHRPFALDQPYASEVLNTFWSVHGMAEASEGHAPDKSCPVFTKSTDWWEWASLKLDWTSHVSTLQGDSRETLAHTFLGAWGTRIDGIDTTDAADRGYVWPCNDPANGRKWFGLQYHFDQMPRFICAVRDYTMWTGDLAYLRSMQPRIEAVMGYIDGVMKAANGLPIDPPPYTGLSNSGPMTTYMDCYREGHYSTYVAEAFYTALLDMAEMEAALGNTSSAATYAARSRRFPARFDAELWNRTTGRYAGWKDVAGALHDYGFTYLNLEALARGLGDADKAYRVFDWLDNGVAQPTRGGAHLGSTDIYQCVCAPRSNTISVPAEDWDSWSVSPTLRASTFKYGTMVEDGGAMVWVNYYDVMARLRWLDADSAWRKLAALLYRCQGDRDFYSENSLNPTNRYGESYLEVLAGDGENGLPPMSVLYGFMGIRPGPTGLRIAPQLPSAVNSMRCADVSYRGLHCTIGVRDSKVVQEISTHDAGIVPAEQITSSSDVLSQEFRPPSAFNKIGVFLGACATAGKSFDVTLSTVMPRGGRDIETQLATRRVYADVTDDNAWVYLTFPNIEPSLRVRYRITLSGSAGGSLVWYRNSTANTFAYPAVKNGVPVGGNYMLRVAEDALADQILQTRWDRCDRCPPAGSLEQGLTTGAPFCRVSVRVGAVGRGRCGCTLTLRREMAKGQIRTVATQRCDGIARGGWVTMSVADQPPGAYSVALSAPAGGVGWCRFSRHRERRLRGAAIGAGAIPGDRAIILQGALYDISVTPGNLHARIKAGQSFVLPAGPD